MCGVAWCCWIVVWCAMMCYAVHWQLCCGAGRNASEPHHLTSLTVHCSALSCVPCLCFSYIRTSSKHAIKEARRERGETLFPADAYADAFADYVHRAVMMKLQEVPATVLRCAVVVRVYIVRHTCTAG